MRKYISKSRKAFTLVEVMLAVGVIAVSITAMIGLLASITASLNVSRHQNKAMTLVSNVETTLQMQAFSTVYRWVQNPSTPYIIFFWDEYQNPDDADNSSLMTMSSELVGTPKEPPSSTRLANGEGDVYRVIISLYQKGLKGQRIDVDSSMTYGGSGGLPGAPDSYALSYIPIKVDIYAEPRNNITRDEGTKEINEQRLVYSDIIMKLR